MDDGAKTHSETPNKGLVIKIGKTFVGTGSRVLEYTKEIYSGPVTSKDVLETTPLQVLHSPKYRIVSFLGWC